MPALLAHDCLTERPDKVQTSRQAVQIWRRYDLLISSARQSKAEQEAAKAARAQQARDEHANQYMDAEAADLACAGALEFGEPLSFTLFTDFIRTC